VFSAGIEINLSLYSKKKIMSMTTETKQYFKSVGKIKFEGVESDKSIGLSLVR
jgi:hypothetical protein